MGGKVVFEYFGAYRCHDGDEHEKVWDIIPLDTFVYYPIKEAIKNVISLGGLSPFYVANTSIFCN